MNDIIFSQILERLDDLTEVEANFHFRQTLRIGTLPLEELLQITMLTVFHHQVDVVSMFLHVNQLHNIWMT